MGLYFQSSRPGGNIFRVERIGQAWSEPVPLGWPVPAGANPGLQFSVARNGDVYGELWVDGDSDLDCIAGGCRKASMVIPWGWARP